MFEECIYFNGNALARSITRLWTEAYKEYDLSPPHAFLLRVVLAKPGLLPRELAHELKLSRSTITRFLDSLEKRGLLIRQTVETDKRELKVFPTKKSLEIHKKLDNTGKNLSSKMADIVGNKELTELLTKLRKIQKTIEKL